MQLKVGVYGHLVGLLGCSEDIFEEEFLLLLEGLYSLHCLLFIMREGLVVNIVSEFLRLVFCLINTEIGKSNLD